MKYLIYLVTSLALSLSCHAEAGLYGERWRPQYHFTPAHRWIGDPCGLVYADSVFHAYSWGAYESSDLLHWREINNDALRNVPDGIGKFTGSVVVDRDNTSGFGNGTYVAAFTSFDEVSKKQSQSVSFSDDKGRNFYYYDRNPVIDIWSTEFRDPTVIWDKERGRWVMLVAKALEKKVSFYSSSNLKDWEWLSDFGPMGDNERSWECPDMFRLPVEDGAGQEKWVLVVSVNWAREQYFVGEFDGIRFIPDHPYSEPLYVDDGLDYYASRVFQDFDGTLSDTYSIGWVSTWDYAQNVPTEYGKGVWSLPRSLSLRHSDDGLRLVQKPFEGIKSLRGKAYAFDSRLKPGITQLPGITEMGNVYEMIMDIPADSGNMIGVFICQGDGKRLVLGYDVSSCRLTLDRTNVSDVEIPKFERISSCKVAPVNGHLSIDLFMDKSVVEIFVNDGEKVMTALAFPPDSAVSASVFSLKRTSPVKITTYEMKSVW